MPSPFAFSAVNTLRMAYRRMWRAGAVGASAAVGMLPLIYLLAGPVWQSAVLGGLTLAYLGYGVYRLRRTQRAVRQLRLEGSFIGHSLEGHHLRSCLERRGHLWAHCRTVRALRRLIDRPLSNLLATDRKRQRVYAEYEQALSGLSPSRTPLGLALGVLLVGGVFAATFVHATTAGWALRTGLASGLVLLSAEGVFALLARHARQTFPQLPDALAEWTLARSVHDLLESRTSDAYRHTRLYRAPAWFASAAPSRGPTAASSESASASSAERRTA